MQAPAGPVGGGGKQLDYLLVDLDIAPLISNLRLVTDTPWAPHCGIAFDINRRPEQVFIKTLRRPKPFRCPIGDDKKVQRWETTDEEWRNALDGAEWRALNMVRRAIDEDDVSLRFASDMGILEECINRTAEYAKWSMAAEGLVTDKLQVAKSRGGQPCGRGTLPRYEWQSLAEKYALGPVE